MRDPVRCDPLVRIAQFRVPQPASRPLLSRSSRSAFAMTMSDAPMSATTAIHSVAQPATASTRNAPFSASENPMFARMLRDGRAAEPNRVGNLQQLVGHQRDVCGLERGVAAGDAHRDADVGRGQRGRVVDAVADHRQRAEPARAAPATAATLSSGSRSAGTSSMPSCAASALRGGFVIAGQQRDVRHALLAEQLDGVARRLARAIGDTDDPQRTRRRADDHRRSAVARQASSRASIVRRTEAALLEQPMAAEHDRAPPTRASAPRPGSASNAWTGEREAVRAARATIARPMGCSERDSSDAASWRTVRASRRSSGDDADDVERRWVNVPVLSNATQRTSARRSRCAPPLIRTPLRAAAASAETIETGVEMTSAQGQEITSRTSAR